MGVALYTTSFYAGQDLKARAQAQSISSGSAIAHTLIKADAKKWNIKFE